jgi:hypothetical protein
MPDTQMLPGSEANLSLTRALAAPTTDAEVVQ